MRARSLSFAVAAILILGRGAAASAQGGADILFDHLTTADGLPANEVLALFQDREGYVWIGTEKGLARYEGSRMRRFHHDRKDPNSLSSEQVNDIAEDPSGVLWMATANGFCRYNASNGTFTRFQLPGDGVDLLRANRVIELCIPPDGSLWLNTEAGPFRIDPRSGRAERLDVLYSAALPRLSGLSKRSMAYDTFHRGLWLATPLGLFFIDPATGTVSDRAHRRAGWECLDSMSVSNPLPDGHGGLWWFDVRGYTLHHQDLMGGAVRTVDGTGGMGLPSTAQCLGLDGSGALWLSTWRHRLFRLAPASTEWEPVVHSDEQPWSVVSENVKCFLLDRNGALWLGTYAGVSRFNPADQRVTIHRIGDEGREITAMALLPKGRLAVGTMGDGVHVLDSMLRSVGHAARPSTGSGAAKEVPQGNEVRCLTLRPDGRLWVGTASGLFEMDPERCSLEAPMAAWTAVPALRSAVITTVGTDRSQRTWIGTWARGGFIIPPKGSPVITLGNSDTAIVHLPTNGVLCWLLDRTGEVWLGLNDGGGTVRFASSGTVPRALGARENASGPSYGVVMCLAEAPDQAIWMGSHQGGLDRYAPKTGSWTTFTRSDGLPSDRVTAIAFDEGGTLWAVTSDGIARLPRGAKAFIPYPLPAGIDPTDLASFAVPDGNGRMWFGHRDELLSLRTKSSGHEQDAPEARIVTARLNDSLVHHPMGTDLLLEHGRKALALELGAVGPGAPGSVRYAYRLADRDTAWTDIGTSARLDLNDLASGDHIVQVRASTDGVHWSASPAEVRVHVLPPFYATWWFLTVSVVLALGLTLLAFRYYLQERLRRQRTQFEREQAILSERVRIAGDMHDDLGAGLSALKLRSEMALRVEKDPVKREQLGALASTAGELIGSMRQIIWTMNADQTSLEDLVVYTTNYARTYAGQNELAITVQAEGPWPSLNLSSEQRRNVFLVVKEALHNIVKHAHAGRVHLGMAWEKGLVVDLRDDGVGLPSGTDEAAGNGLRNMRRRIRDLGGSLSVTNAANGEPGTRILFSVPLPPNQRSIATHRSPTELRAHEADPGEHRGG